ncbi:MULTISPECIES: acyl carrier protein [unclassified Solwaraspora]|uniref:acyl carrier protein n=1 Tax=unclassified Solwaraspora TaxID=2627926 RepID=UPI00248C7ED1|nr:MULTISPECIES: acyl carrier protein [unclassified Solwaraspora]WBB95642.1 acyl carrier protein [Solwaraspora sp. WMMA2059]WBC20454.1 acyl carrier protein [Solwaraspora sp. WMMA2080]WJK37393.1 acyl carrier protein [Solwaraspora sp. WMMA2065]
MFEQLTEIIARKFQLDRTTLAPEMTFQDLELDSLDMVELSLVIDKELGVPVSDDELIQAGTIGAVRDLVESRSTRV